MRIEIPAEKRLVHEMHILIHLGHSSFDGFTALERRDKPGVIRAAGGATSMWVNFPQQKSMPFPDRLRALIA